MYWMVLVHVAARVTFAMCDCVTLKVLARARVNSKTVKVIGNGHSPSDIASTHGYMVSLKNFNKITDVRLVHSL